MGTTVSIAGVAGVTLLVLFMRGGAGRIGLGMAVMSGAVLAVLVLPLAHGLVYLTNALGPLLDSLDSLVSGGGVG